jgi:WD40 repeat protein
VRTQLVLFLAGCLLLPGAWSRVLHAEQKPPPAKLALPSAEEQAKAERNIKAVFKSDFSKAKSTSDKSELAQKLLQLAVEEKEDAISRFVLFRLAMELAAQAGNQKTAYEAIDEMAVHYDVEPLSLKKDVLTAVAKTQSVATPAKDLTLAILKSVDEAIAAERFEMAVSLAKLAEASARLTKDNTLMVKANAAGNKIQEIQNESQSGKNALEVLRAKPDDPAANLAVGKFHCLVKRNWPTGLPLLAKGSDAILKSVAEQDLANPSVAIEQMKLADRWWDLAGGESGAWKACLQKRACEWYRRALPILTGLNKAKAEKRIAEVAPEDNLASKPAASVSGSENKTLGERRVENALKNKATPNAGDRKADDGPLRKGSVVIQAPNQQVMTVAFSPDSKHIVSGGSRFTDDCALRVWDAVTGKQILAIKTNNDFVKSAAFSPDGKWIVGGTLEGMIRLWDANTGKEKMTMQADKWVHCVAFSSDGKRIVSGGGGANNAPGDLRVWDANTGQMLMTNTGHFRGVYCLAISPDGTRFVTGGVDKLVKLWNFSPGQTIRTLTGHTLSVTGVDFSPDNKRMLSCSIDQTIKIWDAATGQEILSIGPTGCCQNAVFSPDGKRIISSGGRVPEIKVWDAETGKEILTFKGHTDFIYALAVSPNGKRAATASSDRTVRLWDLESGQ